MRASHPWDISQISDVPVCYFFDDMSQNTMKSSPFRVCRSGEIAPRETLELVCTCYLNEKLIVQKRISETVKLIATKLLDE